MKLPAQKPGFTILELTFAIMVIGVMMGIVMTTILGMLRFYTFAGVVRQNQAAGRQTLDDITRQVRFSQLVQPSEAVPTDTTLCVADTKNNLLLEYKRVSSTNSAGKPIEFIQKTTYHYDPPVPAACGVGAGVTQVSQAAITPQSMHVKAAQFVRTGGALLPLAVRNAAAVIIQIDTINGTASPTTGNCVAGDIYCSHLQLNTAVEIQGGS